MDKNIKETDSQSLIMPNLIFNLIPVFLALLLFTLITSLFLSDNQLDEAQAINEALSKKWEDCYGLTFQSSYHPNENRREKISRLYEENQTLIKEIMPFVGVGLSIGEEVLRFESAKAIPLPLEGQQLLSALENLKYESDEGISFLAKNKPSETATKEDTFRWFFASILDYVVQSQGNNPVICVEGHTDNVPITIPYPDNFALSHARARYLGNQIQNLLAFKGLHPGKHYIMSLAGCAETNPVVYHEPITNEPKNRRIVLWLYRRPDSGGIE